MIETFDCPACGGPLEYKGGPDKICPLPFLFEFGDRAERIARAHGQSSTC